MVMDLQAHYMAHSKQHALFKTNGYNVNVCME